MDSSLPKKKQETTKQHIFDAARKAFADKGFAGARMDEIARLARVNKVRGIQIELTPRLHKQHGKN